MQVNDQAVRRARRLIEAHQYVLDSAWGDENPSAAEENAYLDAHGWDAYGEWHLTIDPEAGEQTKARHRSRTATSAGCTAAG